ncbi:MAG: ABC transporter permease [Acidobacteriota bacterium]
MSKRPALLLFLVLHGAILGAGLLSPHQPHAQNREAALVAPRLEAGSLHPLGTDRFGRDVFSRLLHGMRLSLLAGWIAALLAISLGTVLGLTAGYLGGWVDSLLMRLVEIVLSLPWIYLLLALRALLPLDASPAATLFGITALIGLLAWARPARLVRGIALEARNSDAVRTARGFGAGAWHVLRRHVFPTAWPTVLTQWALLVPACLVGEVMLSFLGLGVPEPEPSLGTMLATAQDVALVSRHPWLLAPAAALAAIVLSYHGVSQALYARDSARTSDLAQNSGAGSRSR